MEFVHNLAERGLDTNSLLFGTSAKNLNKLQRVQNWAGRIVGGSQRTGWHPLHSAQQLHQLHWLHVWARIQFKLLTLYFWPRTLNDLRYLSASTTVISSPAMHTPFVESTPADCSSLQNSRRSAVGDSRLPRLKYGTVLRKNRNNVKLWAL